MDRGPKQPQEGPPESIVLSSFDGIINSVTRERLGPKDLERAINIDLDDSGQARRRRGRKQVASGAFHSLFNADDGTVYGVKNGQLGIIRSDYSFVSLGRSVSADATLGLNPLSYAQIGPTIYYTGAMDAGKIDTKAKAVSDWGHSQDYWLSPVVNSTATLAAVRGKLLGKPPLATTVTSWHGRLYLGQGNLVWATELFLYDYVDKTKNFFPYEGDITMLGTVGDGYYVGTTEGLWFCQGDFPQKRMRVLDSPVVPGSMVYLPAEIANPPQVPSSADTPVKTSIAFLTASGFCVAQENGEAYNLTEAKFDFPNIVRAASLFRRQDGFNQYVAVTDNGGDPVNNARIGDYVDAEIVRFRGAWIDESQGVRIVDEFKVDVSSLAKVSGAADGASSVAGVGASQAQGFGTANGTATAAGAVLTPDVTLPNLSALPLAVGRIGNWNSFPGASWATNTAFTDVTGTVLRRLTNASTPATNLGMDFEYATGGPRISRPFGASLDTYHVAVLKDAGGAGGGTSIVFFDVQRGVGYVSGSYKTIPTLPIGIIGYCWSMKAAEPHILYFSDKASPDTIHRYDVNAAAYAPTALFNGTNAGLSAGGNLAGWFTQNWAGNHMLWMTPTSSPTTLHFLDFDSGVVTANSSAGVANVNDPRLCKGASRVVTLANNGGTKSFWFVDTNVLTAPFTSASTQGHSDMGETVYYCFNADDANYPLLKVTTGTAPGANGGASTASEVALYNAGVGSQSMNQDSHPNMAWDQTGAGTLEWYCTETDAGGSNLNNRVSADARSIDAGAVYKTAVTFGGGYGAVDRGVNGVYVLNGSGTFVGNLTSVGSRGAVVAGTFYWSGTLLYAQLADSSTPSGFTRLVANAKLSESIGYARQDGSSTRKLCYTYRNENTYNYETTPFCNWSPDGKIAIFGSNFGVNAGRVDLVMAEVPVA